MINIGNLGTGIIISFVFAWPIILLILGFVPFIIAAGFLQTIALTGFQGKDKAVIEEAGQVSKGNN